MFVEADLLDLAPGILGGWAPADAVLSTATFHWVLDHDRLFANWPGCCGAPGPAGGPVRSGRQHQRLIEAGGGHRARAHGRPVLTRDAQRPDDTRRRLEASGFTDVEVCDAPPSRRLSTRSELGTYLETVCLRTLVAPMAPGERTEFLEAVAECPRGNRSYDYVRLNIVAAAPC